MILKEITLRANLPDDINTEILYEIASARADGAELVRVNIHNSESFVLPFNKRFSSLVRTLKNIKATGRIQFYATKDGFKTHNTEAVFLQNKYPQLLEISLKEEDNFIYIKL